MSMHIAVASDHAGFSLKENVAEYLSVLGHSVEDLGTCCWRWCGGDTGDLAVFDEDGLIFEGSAAGAVNDADVREEDLRGADFDVLEDVRGELGAVSREGGREGSGQRERHDGVEAKVHEQSPVERVYARSLRCERRVGRRLVTRTKTGSL